MNPRVVHAAYYIAHIAKSLLWTATDLVAIYALVSLFGLDPARAGWLFLIGLMANAGGDLAVGTWLDRRPGDARGLAMGGLVIAALSFPLTVLAVPFGWPALLAATLAFRLGYAAYDVPHNALLSRLAIDPRSALRL
jgi:Na+/melibiose symporter-like transporter